MRKFTIAIFTALVYLSLLTPFWVFKELLFPFVTSKAFYFRITIELAFPFYLYLVTVFKDLRPNLKSPLSLLVSGFLLTNFLSAVFGVNVNRSLWGNFERMGGVFYLAHLVLLYFYVVCLGQMGGVYIRRFLKALLAVAAVITLNGISGMQGGPTLTVDPSLPSRASSTLGNPIYFASFLVFPLFLSIFFALQSDRLYSRIGYWLLAIVQFLGIIQSGTRGAVVGLTLGLFVAGVVYVIFTRGKIKVYIGSVLLLFVAATALLFVLHDKLPQDTTLRRVFNLNDSNARARFLQWQIALKGVKDYPLLGTGPENYYVVGNKYYDNELYKYDRSWFDKPHNYLLEILVTNGILGFMFYVGMLLTGFLILWRAHRATLISWLETCVLGAGLMVYQIQNLFVFDTIPASLMFYAFLGFVGFLSFEIDAAKAKSQKQQPPKSHLFNFSPGLASTIAGLGALLAGYLIVVANVIPARAARDVNYGYAYAGVDPYKAAGYFKSAIDTAFNFDFMETASKFSDFATGLVRTPLTSKDPAFVDQQLNTALEYTQQVVQKVGNSPVILQKLVNLYFYKSIFKKTAIPPEAVKTAQMAVELAPKRVEARLALAQLRLYQGFLEESAKLVAEAVQLDPTDPEIKWQLALITYDSQKPDEAVKMAEELFNTGFEPQGPTDLSWLVDYYLKTSQKDKAIKFAEENARVNGFSVPTTAKLYLVYKFFGLNEKANALAENFKKTQSVLWPELERLINLAQ